MTEMVKATMPRIDGKKDGNDHHQTPEIVVAALNKGQPMQTPTSASPFDLLAPRPPRRESLTISPAEWTAAKLTPKCIVADHLFVDVARRVAPGGTGKTTLTLWEAVHIALGIPLYGKRIVTPGWVLYITAEDPRERLVARLREICTAMDLTEAQLEQVRRDVLFWD